MKATLESSAGASWKCLRLLIAAHVVWTVVFPASGEGIHMGTNVTVRFSSIEDGRNVLTRRDEFIAALTPLDRRARMRVERDVPEKEFLAFLGRSVQPWTPDETNRIAGVFRAVENKLARWQLPFPDTVLLIKTSGAEEFANAYTRQNAVILPAAMAAGRASDLTYLIPHELFHVLSRHNRELRKACYGIIGFRPINEIELPEELRHRKVTNPDGVENGWMIGLTHQNEAVQAVPILLATGPSFDPNEGGAGPNNYFRLLVVKTDGPKWVAEKVAGRPRLLRPADTTGWFEQIGRNTAYMIHPDEILADNFVRLIHSQTNVPTPRILTDMVAEFTKRESKQ